MYGLHSHSGDLVEEDIYVSDGSVESDEEEDESEGFDDDAEKTDGEGEGGEKKENIKAVQTSHTKSMELVLTTSKMGLMRRGSISSLLGQPMNRTWVRSEQADYAEGELNDRNVADVKYEEEEEITDPALLLAIQQRKIEQAKQNARFLESSENAGRDPCLFSKRTAFDIRMDQIEDKPWEKSVMGLGGGADITDYFNYGLTEEDWLEYAERQITIRQELTDASKQKRLPDPGIVPVVPRAPSKQGERVAVRVKKTDESKGDRADQGTVGGERLDSDDEDGGLEMSVELGPMKTAVTGHISNSNDKVNEDLIANGVKLDPQNHDSATTAAESKFENVVGGAWGAGAKEDSVLLRLIREQSGQGPPPMVMMAGAAPPMISMPPPGLMMAMPPPNMMAPPPPPPPKIAQQQDQERIQVAVDTNIKLEKEGYDEAGQWKRDRHHLGPPPRLAAPHDRERFDSVRDGRGHPDPNYDQYSQSQHPPPNFLHHNQQPPFSHRRGPPPHANGPPGGRGGPDRFPQHPPPHMMRPPMGRGRGDQGGGYFDRSGPGRGGAPPPWVDGRKRPRNEYDSRSDSRRGRW
ncbi:hypothetical protein ACHAWX_001534 [Stephanocyclus meneghinianus]